MRVLYVSHFAGLGGAERSLLELMVALRAHGVRPHLACPAQGALPIRAAEAGFPVIPAPLGRIRVPRGPVDGVRLLGALNRAWLSLARSIRRHRIRLVHTNNTVAQLWAGPATRLTATPCIWHWRDFYDAAWLARILAATADVIVPISRATRDFAGQQLGDQRKLVFVEHGVADVTPRPDAAARNAWRQRMGVSPHQVLVVMAGQSVPRKGHDVLIRAMARACAQRPEMRAVLVCLELDAAARQHTTRLRAQLGPLGGSGAVSICPGVDSMADLLVAADIVAVPSHREPFGRVAVEAMLARRPVVASDTGGLSEIVVEGETGMRVPPGDVPALAAALTDLAGRPRLRAAMGKAGRRRALERHGVQREAATLSSVYRRLLAESGPRHAP